MQKLILLTVLTMCAVTDAGERRIPNIYLAWGTGAWVVWTMCAYYYRGEPDWLFAARDIVAFFARMFMAGALGFPFFVFRMTGAGDIKLTAFMAACLGWERWAAAIAAGLCLGAVLALGKMLLHGGFYQRFSYLHAYIGRLIQDRKIEKYYCPKRDGGECVIPMGVCFLAGTLLTAL